MRKAAFILVLLAFIMNVNGQKMQKKFQRASEMYENKEYDSALFLFASIYNKGIGDQTLIAKSYYNIGVIYLERGNIEEAKDIFKDILTTNFDEMDAGGTGSGLMAEPYAIYKNRSCKILANLAINAKDFKKALEYVAMADKEYPYRHFCGNEYAANDIYMATLYAKCYAGSGDTNRAIQTLIPFCIDDGLASNDGLIDQLCDLIKEKYSREEIKQAVNAAVSGVYIKVIKHKDYIDSSYYAKIFNTELKLEKYSFHRDFKGSKDLSGIELYKHSFKESEFVKQLMQ